MSPRVSLSFCALLALFAMWTVTARAFAAAGDLDPSFSDDGIAEVDFDAQSTSGKPAAGSYAEPIGLQPNGDLIIAGYTQYIQTSDYGYAWPQLNYAALRPDGSLDQQFGEAGTLNGLGFDLFATPANTILDPAGRLLTGGAGSSVSGDGTYVVRLTERGTLDPTFSEDGIATIPTNTHYIPSGGFIARQSDGKIVVATSVSTDSTYNGQLTVSRLNGDGSLDDSFGSNGTVRFPDSHATEAPQGIAVDSHDRILTADQFFDFNSQNQTTSNGARVSRLLPDGQLDPSFAGDGTSELPLNELSYGMPTGLQVDPNDRPYVWLNAPDAGPSLIRLDSSGQLDQNFGSDGSLVARGGEFGRRIGILSNNDLLIPGAQDSGVTLSRATSTGASDGGFDAQPWHTGTRCLSTIQPNALALPSGAVFVAGGNTLPSSSAVHEEPRILVARYLPDGTAASAVSPDLSQEPCAPCTDDITRDCPPYDTQFYSLALEGRKITGIANTSRDECARVPLAAIDRRRGKYVRVASVTADVVGTHAGFQRYFTIKLQRRVSGAVFVRVQSTDPSVCSPSQSAAVHIRKQRHHH